MATNTNAATANPTKPNSNIEAEKQAVFAEFEALGVQEGEGQLARVKCSEKACARGKDGILKVGDGEKAYIKFMIGVTGITKEIGGDESGTQTEEQRGRELDVFIKLGALEMLDGPELLDHAKQRMIKIRETREKGKRGRAWSMLLKFARKQLESPDKPLTTTQIDECFEQVQREEAGQAEKLWGARNTMLKANEGVESKLIQDAINLVDERIAELGGTEKQKKQAKRAAEKKAEQEKAKRDKEKAKAIKRK